MGLRLSLLAALGCLAVPGSAQLIAPNLLYNAVKPCRILDTRITNTMLTAGASRPVNVVGLTDYSAQGGVAGDCHIPGFASTHVPRVQAVMINLTAVGSAGAGDLRAWPTDQTPAPTSSVLNYAQSAANHGLNVANGIILPVRQDSQGGDITLLADSAATHVVADVTGYFTAETDTLGGNLFIGQDAGKITVASGGTLNVGLGDQVLVANTSGCHDVVIGASAMATNAGGSYTVSLGYSSLSTHQNGDYNVAVGAETLNSDQTGAQNTVVGAQALQGNVSGTGNVAIGYWAGNQNGGSASNNIDIGSTGNSADSGVIRIGTPANQGQAFVAGVRGVTTGAKDAVQVLIDSNGQLGTMSSSRTVKEDIHDMADASQRLLELRPVAFRYRQAFADGSKPVQYGLIAEEVAEVFPELVAHDNDGRPETVKYHLLPALLLNEMQRHERELRNQRQELERQLGASEAEAAASRARADRLADELAAQRAEIEALRTAVHELAQRTAGTPQP
jgi:hypothetical protein